MDEFPTALATAAAIRSGALDPVDVVDACIERFDRIDPSLGAIVWRDDDAARADAARIGRRLAAGDDPGPFAGVPVTIKDLTKVAGQPATFGSGAVPTTPATEDARVVAALRRAGFVLCGRTNTPEFGPLPVTENTRYGITRNPWDTRYSPGGSSGGSAAAVAAGMVPVGHGNDGGGSLRIPASCCGLVGFKPSRWRVPSVAPGWFGMAVEGVLTHTVADAAAVLDCLSAPDATVWEQAPPRAHAFADEVTVEPGALRVAVLTTSALGLPVADAPRRAAEEAGRLLEALGHRVSVLDEDILDPGLFGPFLNVVNTAYGEYEDVDWSAVEPHNVHGHHAGQAVDGCTVVASLNELRRATVPVVSRWGRDFDLLVTPTMTIEPPLAGEVLAAAHAAPQSPPATVLAMVAFTVPYNLTGQPAVSLPLHTSPSGLPVGVQLVGGPWGEAQLFQVAAQLERAAPWGDRHPAVPVR